MRFKGSHITYGRGRIYRGGWYFLASKYGKDRSKLPKVYGFFLVAILEFSFFHQLTKTFHVKVCLDHSQIIHVTKFVMLIGGHLEFFHFLDD